MGTENFGGSNFGSTTGGNSKAIDPNKVADKLHNVVDQASERATEFANKAKARAEDFASTARTSIDGWLRDLGAAMERRPLATIAIGVACGYVLAKIRNRG